MNFTYKALSATLDKHAVTGEEIDRQLQRLLQQSPRIAEITDRPTESGDEVVLDYAGFCRASSSPAVPPSARLWCWAAAPLFPALKSSCWIRSPAKR